MRTQSGQDIVNTDITMGRAAGSFPGRFHTEDMSKEFAVFTSEFRKSHAHSLILVHPEWKVMHQVDLKGTAVAVEKEKSMSCLCLISCVISIRKGMRLPF